MNEKDLYTSIENHEHEPLPIFYKKEVLQKIIDHPDQRFIIAMRGPQGSGKDFTAFLLAREAGYDTDQVISTDEYYYLNPEELETASSILEQTGSREDLLQQQENITRLSPQDIETLSTIHREVCAQLKERESDPTQYQWTPEKRDCAQLYARIVAESYLANGKTPIVNVMHIYAYQLKRLLSLSEKEDIEFITLFPDQTQQRLRDGKNETVQIHDGTKWFPENFKNDNIHGVPPERVEKFSQEFEWELSPAQIKSSVQPSN